MTENGIAKDEANNVWHTGHLEDVLFLDPNRLLLAAHSGGVWLASRDEQFKPVALSNSWPKIDIHCLGFGSRGPRHIYAAGEEGALFETETQSLASLAHFLNLKSMKQVAAKLNRNLPISIRELLGLSDAPIFDWKTISIVDVEGNSLGTPSIYQLVCVTALTPPKIVLSTSSGVYWSDVPTSGHDYHFTQVSGVPQTRCLGLALASQSPGVNAHVVCSPQGNPATLESNGIYFGTWVFGKLIMVRANHRGDFDFVQWNDAVVASSAGNRSVLYGVVSATGKARLSLKRAFQQAGFSGPSLKASELAQKFGVPRPASIDAVMRKSTPPTGRHSIYAVISSWDGGDTWSPVGPDNKVAQSLEHLPRDPGDTQNGYNLTVAVSNADVNTMAMGFKAGPWIGRNTPTAFTWEEHGDEASLTGKSPHIHADCHGMHFDSQDATGKTLFMCNDGGLAFTTDLGGNFRSLINRLLPVLQFQSYPGRQASAASGVSFTTPGLVAGPLQDNGVVFSNLQNGSQRPWQRVTVADDGEMGIFLNNDLLLFWNDDNAVARVAKWNGSQFGDAINVTVRTPSPTIPPGSTFSDALVEPVFNPLFQRPDTQQILAAVGADTSKAPSELWGLFTEAGIDPHWEFFTSVGLSAGDQITAVASDNGLKILVGSAQGKIFSYDTPSGKLSPMTTDSAFKQQIYQFVFLNDGVAIARYASGLLRFEPSKNAWTSILGNGLPTSEGPLYFMAADTGGAPDILYVGTDYGVHASWDAGENWLPVSQGLPVRSHASTLRTFKGPDGERQLYLFTWGRSAWRARLN